MASKKKKTASSNNGVIISIFTFIPKTLVLGLFKLGDFIFTLILNIFSFFGIGLYYLLIRIFKAFGFTFKLVYYYFLRYVFNGIDYSFLSLEDYLKEQKRKSDAKRKIKREKKNEERRIKEQIKHDKEAAKKLEPTFKDKLVKYFQEKYKKTSFYKYISKESIKNLEEMDIANLGNEKKLDQKVMYKYIVRDKDGNIEKGYFAAFSKLDVYSYLLDEGCKIYKIETSKSIQFLHGESSLFTIKMKTKDLIFWLTQLSTYIKSGIPLTDAVKLLAKQDKRTKYQKIYDALIYELTMGESFADALARQGKVFPQLLINMIRASELIGDIEGTLDEMANYYDEMETTAKEFKSAMTYPSIVLIFAVGVITFILVYVVPKFKDIYISSGIKVNPITQFLLDASAFLKANYMFIILGIVVIVVTLKLLYTNIKSFRKSIQRFLMKLPVIGKLIIYKEISLFAKTFSALQKSNVLLTDSIDILIKISGNELFKELMKKTITNLIKGNKMSDTFKDNWIIPEIAYYMIYTGEQTGELPNMLDKVANFYQTEQRNMVKTLQSFIEPLMIAFLAVAVGGIILAIIVPMFQLYSDLI